MRATVITLLIGFALFGSAHAQTRQLMTFEEAKQRADGGDPFAQAVVALHYQLGWNTGKNPELAVKYAIASAEAGHPLGQFRLGALLRAGEGVSKDEQQGLALQAASFDGLKASKDAYSLTAAGILIFQGKVVGQTVPEEQRRRNAAALYKQAADMGYAPGQFNYAMALNDGHGVQRDVAKRDDYLERALKLNYPLAITFKAELRDSAAKRSSSAEKERVTLGIQRPAESPSSGELRMEEIALGVEPHERLIVFYKPGARSSADNVEPIVQSESFAFTDSLSSVTGALVHAYTKPNDSGVYLFDAKSKAYLGKVDLDDFPDAGELAHGNPPWGLVLSTDESLLMCQRFAHRGGLVTVLIDTRSLDAAKISGRQFLPIIMADGSSYCLVERPQDEGGSLSAYEWGEDEPQIGSVFAQLEKVGASISWDSLNVLKIGQSLMNGLQLNSRPSSSQFSSGTFSAESKDGRGASYVEQLDMIADRYLSEKQSALSLLSAGISSHAEGEKAQSEKARLLEYASVSGGAFELVVRDEQSDVSRANRYTLRFHPEQFRISAFESFSRPTIVAEDFKQYWPTPDGGKLTSQLVHGMDQENVAWTAKQFEVGKGKNARKFLWPLSIEARQAADSSYDGMVQYYGGDNQWVVYRTELPTRLGIFPSLGIFNVPRSQWIAATDGAGSAILNLGPSRVYGNPYSAKGDSKLKYFVSAESDYLDYGPLFSFDEDSSSVWLATRMSIDQQSPDFANAKLVCLSLEHGKVIDEIPNTPQWRAFAVGATRLIASDDPRSGLAQLWHRQPLKKIGDLVLRADGNLVFVCSDGVYAASMATKSNLAFKIGNRGYPFEQFDLRLNRPDIVLERLGAPEEAVQIAKQLREKRL